MGSIISNLTLDVHSKIRHSNCVLGYGTDGPNIMLNELFRMSVAYVFRQVVSLLRKSGQVHCLTN